ncbi:MAG: hypothetical protein IKX85_01110, partial [Clostridia bacterium]|nr:hypothetical protein [Clostridia bacterium]
MLLSFSLFLFLSGKAEPGEILRAFGGSGTVRDVSLPLFVSLFFAWLASSAVFLWKKPGIGALVLAAPWILAPVLGLRPGVLLLFLAAFAAWALLRRGGKRGIAFLLLCALFLCSVPLGYALSDPASLLLYRAENALYAWSAGRSEGADASGGRVSAGSA